MQVHVKTHNYSCYVFQNLWKNFNTFSNHGAPNNYIDDVLV